MLFSNGEKSKHGNNAKMCIQELLESCKEKKYIKDIIKEYHAGKQGFSNERQFYAPYLIEFPDNDSWIIFSTTSMRTDRVKGQQWDACNLKEINPNISKSFLVYPDSVNTVEAVNFEKQNKKYQKHEEYSTIDAIISQDRLYNLIEDKALAALSSGRIKDIQGRNFEDRIAGCLSNKDNFDKWKGNGRTLTGLYYPFFEIMLNSLKLPAADIKSISATTDKNIIGKLPSGGNPKTDILVEIHLLSGEKKTLTISCKRSGSKKVSVHEYSADSFVEVLDPSNEKLSCLLHEFQKNPSLSSFGEDNGVALTKELSLYKDTLAKWALAGIGGYGKPEVQWASHILTYDNNANTIAFHSVDNYIKLLKAAGVRGNFGTLFSWTYPSKKRGSSIQLKCTIIK